MFPILFHVGSRAVSGYGFFISLGYVLGIILILVLGKKQKFPAIETAAYLLFAVGASILGAKIFNWAWDFFRNPSYFSHYPGELLRWSHGGGATFGAIPGAFLFSVWYLRKFGLPFWPMGDTVAPGIALSQSVMKIGCFAAGCCYGSASDIPWAVTFPGESISRHPTQIYESFFYFLNFIFLLILFHKKKYPGQIIAQFIINFSLIRFFIEFFRGDPERGYLIRGSSLISSLSWPQVFCLAGLILGWILQRILRVESRRQAS